MPILFILLNHFFLFAGDCSSNYYAAHPNAAHITIARDLTNLGLQGEPSSELSKDKTFSSLIDIRKTDTSKIILPKIFNTGMVLQRGAKIPVWGWAKAGEKITVQLKRQQKTVQTSSSGKWILYLNPEKAGGPFQLIISSARERIILDDVLIGDVWVCSGQSNMAFTVKRSINADAEIKAASNKMIRQFYVRQAVSLQPLDDVKGGEWKECTAENVGNFTAVGYFFAREIFKETKVPIGIINSSVGGTHIETWISRQAYQDDLYYREMISKIPTVSVEQLMQQQVAEMKAKIDSVQGPLPTQDEKNNWMASSYDDTKWAFFQQPDMWESKGWPKLDGKVWYRKEVNVEAADVGKEAVLELGTIDETDETYVNGKKVGSIKNKPSQERTYPIEPGILKVGKNIIAVNIEDVGGGGGFGGRPEKMKLTVGNTVVPLVGAWKYKIDTFYTSGFNVNANIYPSLLFNAMISPLMSCPIKGVVWYQGESNAGRAYEYRRTFPLLIKDWRRGWKRGEFPFLFVQLPNFAAQPEDIQKGSTWAELREAQTMALALPNTGMAVTIDIGEAKDIHPTNKQEVGRRLAQIALNNVYGKKISNSGPVFHNIKIEGDKAIITFNNVDNGFAIKGNQKDIKGFTIASDDKVFYYAKAVVDGNKIVVFHDKVKKPVAVRYAWSDNPEGLGIYNKEGYPAAPFRTDKWEGVTAKRIYQIAN